MTAPFVKVLRDHTCASREWIVDRQRPIAYCDNTGRISHVGGLPFVSLRCGALGCTARAVVREHDLIACIEFKPRPKRTTSKNTVNSTKEGTTP
jgi:hypothetical protein